MAARLLFLLLYLILITTPTSGNTSPTTAYSSPTGPVTSALFGTSPVKEPVISRFIESIFNSLVSSNSVSFNFDSIVSLDHVTTNDFVLSKSVGVANPIAAESSVTPSNSIPNALTAPDTELKPTLPKENSSGSCFIDTSMSKMPLSCPSVPQTCKNALSLEKTKSVLSDSLEPLSLVLNTDSVDTNTVPNLMTSVLPSNDIQENMLLSPILGLLASLTGGNTSANKPCKSPDNLTIPSFDNFVIPCCPSVDTAYSNLDNIFSTTAKSNSIATVFPFVYISPSSLPSEPVLPSVSSQAENDLSSLLKSVTSTSLTSGKPNGVSLKSDDSLIDETSSLNSFSPSSYFTDELCYPNPKLPNCISDTLEKSLLEVIVIPDIEPTATYFRQCQPDAINKPTFGANNECINTFDSISVPIVGTYNHVPLLTTSSSALVPSLRVEVDLVTSPLDPLDTLSSTSTSEITSSNHIASIQKPKPVFHDLVPPIHNVDMFSGDYISNIRPQFLNVFLDPGYVLTSPTFNNLSTRTFLDAISLTLPNRSEFLPNYLDYLPSFNSPRVPVSPLLFPVTDSTQSFTLPYPYHKVLSPIIIPVSSPLPVVSLLEINPSPVLSHHFSVPLLSSNDLYSEPIDYECLPPITIKPPEYPIPLKFYDMSRFLPKFNDSDDSINDIKENPNDRTSIGSKFDNGFNVKYNNAKENINKLKYGSVFPKELKFESSYLTASENSKLTRPTKSDNSENNLPVSQGPLISKLNVATSPSDSLLEDYIANIKYFLSMLTNEPSLNICGECLDNGKNILPISISHSDIAKLESVSEVLLNIDTTIDSSLATNDNTYPINEKNNPVFDKVQIPLNTVKKFTPLNFPILVNPQTISNEIPHSVLENDILTSSILPYISSVTVEVLPKVEPTTISCNTCNIPTVNDVSDVDCALLDDFTAIDELLKLVFLSDMLNDDNVPVGLVDDLFRKLYNTK